MRNTFKNGLKEYHLSNGVVILKFLKPHFQKRSLNDFFRSKNGFFKNVPRNVYRWVFYFSAY